MIRSGSSSPDQHSDMRGVTGETFRISPLRVEDARKRLMAHAGYIAIAFRPPRQAGTHGLGPVFIDPRLSRGRREMISLLREQRHGRPMKSRQVQACLEKAACCERMAAIVSDADARLQLAEVAKQWQQLARQIEE